MILAIDVGNSNLVLGGYQGGRLRFMSRAATNRQLEADQYAIELGSILRLYGVDTGCIKGVVMSSVVPEVTRGLLGALAHFTSVQPVVLSLADAGPITVDIENPEELGMDILASAIATCEAYPLPAVIIDMGTATKLTAFDKNCVLRGVSISPGLFLSLNALVGGASLQRSIELNKPLVAIG